MKITYNISIEPIYAETHLIDVDNTEESDLYLHKREGYLGFKMKINNTKLESLISNIKDVEKTRKGYKVVANTTNIVGTNIRDSNNVPYYFEIKSNKVLKLTDIDFLTVIERNNKFYTNTSIPFRELPNGISIFTEYVKDLRTSFNDVVHTFKKGKIEINFLTDLEDFVFRTTSQYAFYPELLNENLIAFPSFIFNNKAFIEGDVRILDKTEYLQTNLNIVKPKYKILEYESDSFSITNNLVLLDEVYLQSKLVPLHYLAKYSTHQFQIENKKEYFTISNTKLMIEKGTKKDHDFSIELEIDLDYISLYTNKYKNESSTFNRPQDFIFHSSKVINEIAFKKYLPLTLNFFPSETPYIQLDNTVYYSHRNKMILDVPTLPNEGIEYSMNLTNEYLNIQQEHITYFKKEKN